MCVQPNPNRNNETIQETDGKLRSSSSGQIIDLSMRMSGSIGDVHGE